MDLPSPPHVFYSKTFPIFISVPFSSAVTDQIRHLVEQILDILDDAWWDDQVPVHSLHITIHVNVLTTIASSQFDIQQDFRNLLSFLIPTLDIEFEVVIQQWLRASRRVVGEHYWAYRFNSTKLRSFH